MTIVSLRLIKEAVDSTRKRDRKSTRLNSSHVAISYAVFCLKKKKRKITVFAYYMTTWNPELAEQRPEWLVLDRERTSSLHKFDESFGCSLKRGSCIVATLCR